MSNKPIGIFDSGVGGTSIWKAIINRLPHEDTVYLADSINAPYGEKSIEDIIAISIKNTELLIDKGAKLIVVACNTATTNAIEVLRSKFSVPFVGIEPAIKPAALATKTNAIGILATKGTLSSSLFHKTSQKFASDIVVVEQEGTGLVPLIEKGKIESKEMQTLLSGYLNPMMMKNIDHLVLGCSHYPYLIPSIKNIIGNQVKIIDSGFAVAKQVQKLLEENDLSTDVDTGNHLLMSNNDSDVLTFLTKEISNTNIVEI